MVLKTASSKLAVPPSSTSQIPCLELEALFIIHGGRGLFFSKQYAGNFQCYSHTPLWKITLLHSSPSYPVHKHRGTLGPSRGPQGRSRLDPSPEEGNGDVLFQFVLGPVGGLCVAEQTSSAGVSQKGICLGRVSAGGGGSSGWNFLERSGLWNIAPIGAPLKHFHAHRKGIPLWNIYRHWGVHLGLNQKLSVVLAASVLAYLLLRWPGNV